MSNNFNLLNRRFCSDRIQPQIMTGIRIFTERCGSVLCRLSSLVYALELRHRSWERLKKEAVKQSACLNMFRWLAWYLSVISSCGECYTLITLLVKCHGETDTSLIDSCGCPEWSNRKALFFCCVIFRDGNSKTAKLAEVSGCECGLYSLLCQSHWHSALVIWANYIDTLVNGVTMHYFEISLF